MPRTLLSLVLVSATAVQVALLLVSPLTTAAEESQRRSVSRVTRDFASRRLEAANRYTTEQKYEKALTQLRQIEKSKRVSDYERALAFQGMGFIYSAIGDYQKSARAFKSIKPGLLQPSAELNMLYNLGQLYVALDRADDAINALERWFKLTKNPNPQARITIANAYVQAKRYDDALPHVEKACLDRSTAAESWLQLLVALHIELSHYKNAVRSLETVVERFPRATYWSQLSSLYWYLGREREALIALELANTHAPLTSSSDVSRLAQLLLHHKIPYKAAIVLERALSDGTVNASWRDYDLLASSLLQAREVERAFAPLTKAASLSPDGKLWLRLAQIRIHREEWDEAERALEGAQTLGGFENPGTVSLLFGITRLHQGNYGPAREALLLARSYPETRRAATEYITYLQDLEAKSSSD